MQIRRDGVLLLRGLDSRLSKDLPSDLQKLRCKVYYVASSLYPYFLTLLTLLEKQWVYRNFRLHSSKPIFILQVAFSALRFAPHISEIGEKLTERMRSKGPYVALHLRMEKDVWVRTGCLPGLSPDYDEMINNERKTHPKLLTSRSNMTYHQRKLNGLCPLNSLEVARCVCVCFVFFIF